MSHIIAINSKVSIEYIIIGNNKELAMIGAVAGKDTVFVLPAEIIWDKSFIGEDEVFFFNTN